MMRNGLMIKKLAILVFMLIFASSIVLAQTIDVTPSTILSIFKIL